MKNKDIYFLALVQNNGALNEIDLGEQLGFEENETMRIISQLLAEHKIMYAFNYACNYSVMKKTRRKDNY